MSFPEHLELNHAQTIEHYIQLVLGKRPEGSEIGWFFRGQASFEWVLQAQIDRPSFREYRVSRGWSRAEHEQRLLSDFMRGGRPHARLEPHDPWEWLALAQHFGLATRLLDWTANPLAALYFAVENRSHNGDSAVWCYHHLGRGWTECREQSPFELQEIIEFRPAHLTPRITVQGGCFTAQPDPSLPCPPNGGDLRRIRIPAALRATFRKELRKLGIDRASLFPDLDGIAYSVNCHLSDVG